MEYSKNLSINAHIQQCLEKLPAPAAAKFRRNFRDQDDEQSEQGSSQETEKIVR